MKVLSVVRDRGKTFHLRFDCGSNWVCGPKTACAGGNIIAGASNSIGRQLRAGRALRSQFVPTVGFVNSEVACIHDEVVVSSVELPEFFCI